MAFGSDVKVVSITNIPDEWDMVVLVEKSGSDSQKVTVAKGKIDNKLLDIMIKSYSNDGNASDTFLIVKKPSKRDVNEIKLRSVCYYTLKNNNVEYFDIENKCYSVNSMRKLLYSMKP